MIRRPPRSTLVPYPPLFRCLAVVGRRHIQVAPGDLVGDGAAGVVVVAGDVGEGPGVGAVAGADVGTPAAGQPGRRPAPYALDRAGGRVAPAFIRDGAW